MSKGTQQVSWRTEAGTQASCLLVHVFCSFSFTALPPQPSQLEMLTCSRALCLLFVSSQGHGDLGYWTTLYSLPLILEMYSNKAT